MFNVIPQPNEIIITGGKKGFFLTGETTVTKMPVVEEFRDFVKKVFDIRIHRGDFEENSIILSLTEEIENPEGYRLVSRDSNIYIYGRTQCGIFYGLQTLKQLLLQGFGKLPDMYIEDKPLYSYRGFMLDSGRYYQSVKEIKRIIDLMALHKMNVFHWHLTEDQGWRVEIKKYPELTEKGSKRSHTNFGIRSEEGYYTQEQVKEIVDYCHKRFIKVIPEFDIPGHTVSAIACYPYLSCFDRDLNVATHWGVKHDILCAGKDSTYEFVYGVLDELMEMFPDKIIHLGGDEAVKMRWKLCPNCQALMKKENINSEEQLQHYFMSKVNAYLKEKGYSSMMWNYDGKEPTDLLSTDIIWQMWSASEKSDVISKEQKKGRKIVNSDSAAYYLDFPYGWLSLKKAYEYAPELPDGDILGIEAPLWTEYVPNMKKAEYRIFPRLAAVSEIAWSAIEDRSYDRFSQSILEYFDLLNVYGVQYATLSKANPSKIRGFAESVWFNRRQLHWQGLHNIIDDKKVSKLAKKYNK